MDVAEAVVLTAPRTLEYREIPLPPAAADDGILRVEACGLCGSDWDQYRGLLGPGMPIIPGHEILGTIERAGDEALRAWGLAEGDRVVVDSVVACGSCAACASGAYKRCLNRLGYGVHLTADYPPGLWGGYASHVYLHPRVMLQRVPSNIPTEVISLFNALSNAIAWTIDAGGVKQGSSVVICGPGQRGLCGVVAAREAGASQIIVTGTHRDESRLAMARRLGANATIDVEETDPVAAVRSLTDGAGVDVVVEMSAGATEPVVQAIEMVRPGGTIVLAGMKGAHRPVNGVPSDTIALKEIHIVGAFSSGQSATARAIDMLSRRTDELAPLCTHAYDLRDAELALRVLGREVVDGRDAIHVHLRGRQTI